MSYSILYADPPWQYGDRKPRGGAERHYPTMTLEGVCNLQVNGRHVSLLADDPCALFMWATWPLLAEALHVIREWGFTYKTCAFTWVKSTKHGKDFVGMGRYMRGNTEPCLLAVRGDVLGMKKSSAVRQLILDHDEEALVAPVGRHSAKPQEARDRIVQLLGDVPRVELFARERAPGWDAWGNEV